MIRVPENTSETRPIPRLRRRIALRTLCSVQAPSLTAHVVYRACRSLHFDEECQLLSMLTFFPVIIAGSCRVSIGMGTGPRHNPVRIVSHLAMADAISAGRVGAGEQVAQCPAPAQRHPNPPAVLRPVMQQVAPLAQRPDVAVPASTVRRVVIEMCSRQHDLGRPERHIAGQARGPCDLCRPARSVPSHPTSDHRPDAARSRHAADHRPGSAPWPGRTGPSG